MEYFYRMRHKKCRSKGGTFFYAKPCKKWFSERKLKISFFFFTYLECLRRNNPPNGRLQCESARYEVNSRCYLVCDPGYLPLGMTQTTCVFKDDINDYDWDVEAANFVCIPPISLLIGGQDSTLK